MSTVHGGLVPDRVALGDGGAVVFTVTPAGVRLVDIEAAPGWRAVLHHPKGFFARRRPADALALRLHAEGEVGERMWEFELSRLADGTWEAAVLEGWTASPHGAVLTAGGEVRTAVTDAGQLQLARVDARDGWDVRADPGDGHDVVVVFARQGEEWEVVVALSEVPDVAHVEVDHRWAYEPRST